jgi:hypothetical protein
MYEYGLPNSFPLMVEADASLISSVITDEEISKEETLGTHLLLQLIQKMQKTLMMRYQ